VENFLCPGNPLKANEDFKEQSAALKAAAHNQAFLGCVLLLRAEGHTFEGLLKLTMCTHGGACPPRLSTPPSERTPKRCTLSQACAPTCVPREQALHQVLGWLRNWRPGRALKVQGVVKNGMEYLLVAQVAASSAQAVHQHLTILTARQRWGISSSWI